MSSLTKMLPDVGLLMDHAYGTLRVHPNYSKRNCKIRDVRITLQFRVTRFENHYDIIVSMVHHPTGIGTRPTVVQWFAGDVMPVDRQDYKLHLQQKIENMVDRFARAFPKKLKAKEYAARRARMEAHEANMDRITITNKKRMIQL